MNNVDHPRIICTDLAAGYHRNITVATSIAGAVTFFGAFNIGLLFFSILIA
ncbi:MAG: hypothetical protein OEZ58_03060 [Gammaproteobacteria bacterium]|nr:hypothetical protein [Gammaproteobacteria bacterium]MDH5727943.1 hypothetical protein [Gammaproteobacteria bacterium]